MHEPLLPNPPAVYVPPAMRGLPVENTEIQRNETEIDSERQMSSSTKAPENVALHRIPFPERLEKPKKDKQFTKFLEAMKSVQITIPILDAVLHVPLYAKFFKELLTKKRNLEEPEIVALTKDCSAIIQNKLPEKLGDPGSFCIPCLIGTKNFSALCDLGSSVSVLPLSIQSIMNLGEMRKTTMTLQLADRTLRKPAGILADVPVMVGKFAYPVDFVVLEMEDNSEAVILGRPFLATAGAMIDVKGAKLTLTFGNEQATFDMKTRYSHSKNRGPVLHSGYSRKLSTEFRGTDGR